MTNKTILTDEQIALMRRDEFVVWRAEDHENIERFARAIEQAVLQSEQAQAWKKDAERYGWLRDLDTDNDRIIQDMLEARLSGDDLDASIDAAMEKQP